MYLELIWINRHPVNLEIECVVENLHPREPHIAVLRIFITLLANFSYNI